MPSAVPRSRPRITGLAAVTLALGVLALTAPLGESEYPASRIGALLALAAVIEALHSLRRSTAAARREATVSAVISMAIALFLINAPLLAGQALRLVIAGWFGLDAVRYAIDLLRSDERTQRAVTGLAALGNLAVVLLILLARGWLATMVVALAGALRIFGIAWNIIVAPVYTSAEADETVDRRARADGLSGRRGDGRRGRSRRTDTRADRSRLDALVHRHALRDPHRPHEHRPDAAFDGRPRRGRRRRHVHRRAVHAARDQPDLPHVAGPDALDRATGVAPAPRSRRRPAHLDRSRDRGVAALAADDGHPDARAALLGSRRARPRPAARAAVCRDHRRHRSGLGHELVFRHRELGGRHVELLGRVAHRHLARSDGARGAGGGGWQRRPHELCRRTRASAPAISRSSSSATRAKATPRSMCLRDQLLTVANSPDVRFVVISSDVVYPSGAMSDYEAKFWLPFKGVTRPVYAIPGNHDWYDALEGLRRDVSPGRRRARQHSGPRGVGPPADQHDRRTDRTAHSRTRPCCADNTASRPASSARRSSRCRPTGFALLAIDTGVMRKIDPEQERWLDGALARAAGKTIMAMVGHPFFAGGHDVTLGDDEFTRLKRTLLDRGVTIVMAGDTHDLEYYAERRGAGTAVHHFVNGGGGAYLSFGTALSWPAAVADCRLGALSQSAGRRDEDRGQHAVVEAAGMVVDHRVQRLAVLGRVAVGGVRLQRRAVLSELRRSQGRAVGQPRARRAVRRQRASDMDRPRRVGQPAAARCRRTRVGRMDDSDDALTVAAPSLREAHSDGAYLSFGAALSWPGDCTLPCS